ncbi:PSPA7_2676 family Cys-rich small protein [Pseudomonas entomophila]|uniref:PSPA7_2676 family Cys-rich small protein n=1 Tax=Pseudomonas entomophila TaxID=312306 RepID=A0ABY9QHA2_9PSED|nr:PSPA7_2676 family Cys-rich small protein [Pseudomonas entomophila]WMW03418.1 PSPA7_2676 family Cys-rich small protein [Pseudomonas entomophila]
MKLVCLVRGCVWRSVSTHEFTGLECQCCERCGALRYHQPFDA